MTRRAQVTIPQADDDGRPTDPRSYQVAIGAARLPLVEFLAVCLPSGDGALPEGVDAQELETLRDRFLEAGVRALEQRVTCAADWYQIDLQPPALGFAAELYARIGQLVRHLLDEGSIGDFFFMHKPPGLRLRFRAEHRRGEAIAAVLRDQLEGWQAAALIRRGAPAVYEPETQLFGGPLSMPHVHALFTHDSLAWLDHLAASGSEPAVSAPAWVLSLAMLGQLFHALGIGDWEDIDVWDRVRRRMGRSLPGELIATAGLTDSLTEIAVEICARWTQPHLLLGELPALAREILERFGVAIEPIAASWQREYLPHPDACLGRRGMAALLTIFHWNRASLPATRQALLAEALATREVV